MPVTVLYCEGHSQSIDIRVLRQLLPKCDIRPLGGKTSTFMSSIIADRRRNPNLACLVDRDFDCRDLATPDHPLKCDYEQEWVGWTWARKEIENYLIDPEVVQKALEKKAPNRDEYQKVLDNAAKNIATYSAARTALACENFKNFWGNEVRTGHCFPPKLGKDYCQKRIAEIVRENSKYRLVSEQDIQNKFSNLLPQFRPDGSRFKDYLKYFAGKDLLYAMREQLCALGFEDSSNKYKPEQVFVERIVNRIERIDKVWEWLPEWTTLHQLIKETDFSGD
ncbi:MAG: DUF4435 domain-containing protein [Symploca sp. SIO1B1]|nr:DUF4435 domain-containing protein [Symploca sp. SIO1C2]NER92364.1 DUF4435 domain-containing protein [Symploca sp. SIO1B1]